MTKKLLIKSPGTLVKKGPGVWRYRFCMGKDLVSGKYKYTKWFTVHAEKKTDAAAVRDEHRWNINNNGYYEDNPDTVTQCARLFHENQEAHLAPTSYDRERLEVERIILMFGHLKLQELRPSLIERIYTDVRKNGVSLKDGTRKHISEAELHKTHVKFKQILDYAVRDSMIRENPASKVKFPKPRTKENRSLTPQRAAEFRAALLSDYEAAPSAEAICSLVLLDSGIRRGEALGLTWNNVLLDEGRLNIVQQYTNDKVVRDLKTKGSKRIVAISPSLVELLRSWKHEQASELGELRLEANEDTPVIHAVGRNANTRLFSVKILDPNNFDRWFRRFCIKTGFGSCEGTKTVRYVKRTVNGNLVKKGYDEEAWAELQKEMEANPGLRKAEGIMVYKTEKRPYGYSGLTPHMLRHTHTTILVHAGVDPNTVQARMGHSSISTTLNFYTHSHSEMDAKASSAFEAALGGGEG